MNNKRNIFGYLNMGVDSVYVSGEPPEAKNYLVLLVVALNSHWKLPIG